MVGLSVVLESHKSGTTTKKTNLPLVIINKATMMINKPTPLTPPSASGHRPPPPAVAEDFLDACLLCRQKLLPGKDIYMYKGDRAFCSEECRWKQMLMEEEENTTNINNFSRRKERTPNNNCSLAAMKPVSATAGSSTTRLHNRRRATRLPPPAGGFAR